MNWDILEEKLSLGLHCYGELLVRMSSMNKQSKVTLQNKINGEITASNVKLESVATQGVIPLEKAIGEDSNPIGIKCPKAIEISRASAYLIINPDQK